MTIGRRDMLYYQQSSQQLAHQWQVIYTLKKAASCQLVMLACLCYININRLSKTSAVNRMRECGGKRRNKIGGSPSPHSITSLILTTGLYDYSDCAPFTGE